MAQTLVDDEIRAEFALDGIVTLVDAAHIDQQLGRSDESTEQIAFADVLVLNKTDLVHDESLDALEARLRDMNRMTRMSAANRQMPVETVLNLSAFDLDQVLERRPSLNLNIRSSGPASTHLNRVATKLASPKVQTRPCLSPS